MTNASMQSIKNTNYQKSAMKRVSDA